MIIFTADDMEGFFVEADAPPRDVNVFGVSGTAPEPACRHDVELQVLDLRGEVVGAYYIGEAQIVESHKARAEGFADLVVSFLGYSCPFPYGGSVWRYWTAIGPKARGEWRQFPADWHSSWLHVVQTAWFQAGREATRYRLLRSHFMDGSGMANAASLYCELGEAINGPRGYFGWGPDALADCLRSAVGSGSFQVVWQDFDMSEESLGESSVDEVASLLREFGVQLILRRRCPR
jgi:hypothetical protein